MPSQDLVELERPAREAISFPDSSPKTILVHLDADESIDSRLETALCLARTCSAHLECFHVTPIEAYVAFDTFGGVFVMNDVIKALDFNETELRSVIANKLRQEDVSWSYEHVTGDVAGQLVSHAALADLLVVARRAHKSDFPGASRSLLGDLLYGTRTPLFIPGGQVQQCDPAGTAMIAWDGSYEAANTIRSSVGLLKLASYVHILQIIDGAKKAKFPSTRLLDYLSRHGIHAELSVIEAGVDIRDEDVISATIVARAEALNAAYVVMGGYNHSRIGEYIFGGVTRTMLSRSPVSIVIAR